ANRLSGAAVIVTVTDNTTGTMRRSAPRPMRYAPIIRDRLGGRPHHGTGGATIMVLKWLHGESDVEKRTTPHPSAPQGTSRAASPQHQQRGDRVPRIRGAGRSRRRPGSHRRSPPSATRHPRADHRRRYLRAEEVRPPMIVVDTNILAPLWLATS